MNSNYQKYIYIYTYIYIYIYILHTIFFKNFASKKLKTENIKCFNAELDREIDVMKKQNE